MEMKPWKYDDGGRCEAGLKGDTRDCVTRAIAIATGLPYREVYDELHDRIRSYISEGKTKKARRLAKKRKGTDGTTPRNGVPREVYRPWLVELGFVWTPTMQVGQGCTVHLRRDELPSGRIIARCSKHLVAVVDGLIHDTHDSSRGGKRCVYGYWSKGG